ncbi:hypothetical protein [Flyfo microvirus Tbat2_98]|nr:hypothetical protein [Flyfo microvirus Tbat2_98]
MNPIQSALDGIVTRLGTAISAALTGYGIHSDHVNVLVPAILMITGVAFDMAVGVIVKRRRGEW